MAHIHPTDPLLQDCERLKFTTSSAGVSDLESKGWVVLQSYGPLADNLFYWLLGQPRAQQTLEDAQAEIARLKAELVAK